MEAYKKANPKMLAKDHGGVHIFSGIPNRAFVICALAFGGKTWDKAGQIWWLTATSRRIPDECTFLQFADVTVAIAQEKFGASDAQIVRNAWNTVGVVRRGI
jgi:Zn-dependent metalloprotease